MVDSLQLTDAQKAATPVNWQPGDRAIIVPSVIDDAEARGTLKPGQVFDLLQYEGLLVGGSGLGLALLPHGGLSAVGLYIGLAAVVSLVALVLIRPASSDVVGGPAFAGQSPAGD